MRLAQLEGERFRVYEKWSFHFHKRAERASGSSENFGEAWGSFPMLVKLRIWLRARGGACATKVHAL